MNKQQYITDVATELRKLAVNMNVKSGWAESKDVHLMIVEIAGIRARLSSLEYTLRRQEEGGERETIQSKAG